MTSGNACDMNYLLILYCTCAALLEVYGPCISTAGWDDWTRNREIFATPCNESIMRFVWNEALRQITAMLGSWVGVRSAGISSL